MYEAALLAYIVTRMERDIRLKLSLERLIEITTPKQEQETVYLMLRFGLSA